MAGADVAFLLPWDGVGVDPLLAGMSLPATGSLERRFQTSFVFLRQLGASIGVGLAVLIEQDARGV
jgi:hypothetical protein